MSLSGKGLGIGIDVDIHNKEVFSKDIKLIPIEDGISWNVYVAYEKSKEDDKKLQQFATILTSK
ncbi:MAG: hypothetical protein IJR96_00840 [Pseudobutyrivibrio sp.]|nr:hypothetical protein [Pseudobutyrivibrio sp.]